MIKDLNNKLKFIELIDEMKNIERAIFLRNNRRETNAEHSFHLAMIIIAFADDYSYLNLEKCLKFALIHDIVEIYAWDTILFDIKMEKTKKAREQKSLEKLEKDFWNILPDFIDLLKEYENKTSKEAKYVYSLDKIQPIIQASMEWRKTWHNWKIDFQRIKNKKYSQIYPEFWLDKILDKYFKKIEIKKMK